MKVEETVFAGHAKNVAAEETKSEEYTPQKNRTKSQMLGQAKNGARASVHPLAKKSVTLSVILAQVQKSPF